MEHNDISKIDNKQERHGIFSISMILPVKNNSFLLGTISVFEFCDIHLPHLPGQKKFSSTMKNPVLEKITVKSYKNIPIHKTV